MALTQEQKKLNKEASLLKQAAHRARRNEFDAELKKIDVSKLHEAAEDASAKFDAALKVRNNEAEVIRAKIAELQYQLGKINENHKPLIEASNKKRQAAYKALYSEREKQTQLIESRYPDLNDAEYSSTGWNAPAGYIERFAQENAEAIAKKKAKRERTKK